MNTPNLPLSQLSNKTFPQSIVSGDRYHQVYGGQHQRLIREPGGRHVLIVRLAGGLVQRIPVIAFERGVIA